jgi:hypothetical protein
MKNFLNFVQAYKQNPINLFAELLNQSKYKYLYLIVGILGLTLSSNNIIDKIYLLNTHFDLATLLFSLTKTILITFVVIFIYSWFIVFINSIIKGYSSQKDIFAVIAYSLVPWIIGRFLVLSFKFVIYTFVEYKNYYLIIYSVLFAISLVFYIWSLICLIVGNAIVNSIPIIKSIISSALLPTISIVYQVIKVIKMHSLLNLN